MSFEHGKEEQAQGVPYEPQGNERRQAAAAVYQKLRDTIGGSDIVRFSHFAGRYKVTIPRDESLLQHTTFELMSTGMGFIHLRATVDLPCSPPGEGIFYQDPYIQMVDVYVSKAERMQTETEKKPAESSVIQPYLRAQGETRHNTLLAIGSAAFLAAAFCITTHCTKTKEAVKDTLNKPADKKHEKLSNEHPIMPEIGPR